MQAKVYGIPYEYDHCVKGSTSLFLFDKSNHCIASFTGVTSWENYEIPEEKVEIVEEDTEETVESTLAEKLQAQIEALQEQIEVQQEQMELTQEVIDLMLLSE